MAVFPLDAWSTEALAEARMEALAAAERTRADAFLREEPRCRFIAARATLRRVLAGLLGIQPAEVVFAYGPQGKPCLAKPPEDGPLTGGGGKDGSGSGPRSGDEAGDWRFNLSHSHGWAALAVGRGHDLGVDLERRRTLRDWEGLARRFFEPEEVAELHSLPTERAFFALWTAKEAFLKARGGAIFDSLPTFRVAGFANGQPRVAATFDDPAEAARWRLHPVELHPDFACTVATAARATLRAALRANAPA